MATNNIKLANFKGRGHHHRFPLTDGKGPVIIYRLAVGGGGGGAEDFWVDILIFGRTKGRNTRNWEPKGGDQWKLWKDTEGGPLKFAWKMKT